MFDVDELSRLEILRVIWELGYEFCGALYYKEKEGKFIELSTDVDVTTYASSFTNDGQATVYVDSPYDDMSQWKRAEEEDRGAHIIRATITNVDNMCIERTLKEDLKSKSHATEESEYSNSNSESESLKSTNEAYDAEIEDIEGLEGSEVETEVIEARKVNNKERVERARKKKEASQNELIKLGPVGIYKGLESYFRSGNSYNGLLAGDEEYIDSSDVDSFASDGEDENGEVEEIRRKNTRVHYNPKCEEPLWELGMVFESANQFREAVVNYAIKKRVQTYYQQNENHRVRVRCSFVEEKENKKCPWHLYASIETKSENFVIKNYHRIHDCVRQNQIGYCNARLLAKYFREFINENPHVKVLSLQDEVKKKLQLQTSKNLCRKARSTIVGEMVGDYREEFRRLYDYSDYIMQTNPGSTRVIDAFTEVEALGKPINYIFKGMDVCFAAMKEGFSEGCHKCIGLDGCFLKGVFKGQILAADQKMQIIRYIHWLGLLFTMNVQPLGHGFLSFLLRT